MILTIPLYPGTLLANVRYFWIVAGVEQPPLSTGITQPDTDRPVFRFDVVPPVNAEEIIAYDNTAPNTNWNVGQYRIAALAPVPASTPVVITVPTLTPPGMRTVTLRSVYESILRQSGFDPVGDAVTHDTARAICEQINTCVMYAWRYWEWSQLELLQERAFRTTWTSSLQFNRVNSEGVPDELYYEGDQNYYRVLGTAPADPPIGTLPTNTNYFTPFDLTDRYISLDQVNETPIGEVIEIFVSDPRLSTQHDARRVPYQPTEHEVTVLGGTNPTVFVLFRIVPSQFSLVPYVAGKDYAVGDLVYNTTDGECYRILTTVTTSPDIADVPASSWVKVPFPAIFSNYVIMAAFAAGLGESGPGKAFDVQRYQAAIQAANEALTQEVDRLRAQGQRYRYKRWRVPYDSS